MRWHVFAVGKPKLAFAREGIAEYAGRLRAFAPTELEWVKPGAGEGRALLERSKGMHRVVLDERGEEVTSRGLAGKFAEWERLPGNTGRDVAVIVGGADGLAEEVRAGAGWVWALSRLTLQHEMALLFALEQLYRAHTIKAGLPYHRE